MLQRICLIGQKVFHLDNVWVIPVRKYILSYITLPSYFQKAKIQEEIKS